MDLSGNKNKKRRLIGQTIIAFVMIAIAGYSLSLVIREPQSNNTVPPNPQSTIAPQTIEKTKETTLSCNTQDNIDYFYYKEVAAEDKKNNKFGLYVYAEVADYFDLAEELVNSNGGEWGYVLIPYNMTDRDTGKWGRVFRELTEKKLIPIIQLNAVDTDDYEDQTEDAAKFLNQFLWPIKERYISAYNEMNDSKFWFDRVDPEEYARILDYTIKEFKDQNENFFIMNGALNITAPNDSKHMDGFLYMREMNEEVPGIFEKLDGWASHPYPQPFFTGSPYAQGRFSIRAYETELAYLKNELGVKKNLPVFITETGWPHAEGEEAYESSFLPVDKVTEYFKIAFEEYWLKDDRVVAVTPFTIYYNPPFDHFSWVNKDKVPYKHFQELKKLKKVKGNPETLQVSKTGSLNCF